MFIESSAKAGFNIKALFRKLATALPGMETSAASQVAPASNCKSMCIEGVIDVFVCLFCGMDSTEDA